MFDTATCTAVGARWDAWLVAARQSPGAFGELPDLPGPDLAGALDQWDPQSRADDELIDRIGSWEKLRAWVDAGQLADIVELTARRRHADELERADHAARGGQGEPGHLMEFVVDEIALAARISRVAAHHRLDLAQDLTGQLPDVFTALRAGEVDLGRARIISSGTRALDQGSRVRVADKVLGTAPSQTAAALRSAVARAVHIIDPSGTEDRHTKDLADRRVTVTPAENGMSHLWALLPADGAAAIMATLHRLAEASHTPADRASGDRRTADQRRADALIDLATSHLDAHPALHTPAEADNQTTASSATAGPAPRKRRTRRPPAWAQVQVVLPANLLTGRGPEPAELIGYGPIPTSMALSLAADATWQRLLTDPVTGALTTSAPPATSPRRTGPARDHPGPALPIPRLPPTPHRPRPHDQLSRRAYRRLQPRRTLPTPPPPETAPPMAGVHRPGRTNDLDHPHRTHPHHPATPARRTGGPTTFLAARSRFRVPRWHSSCPPPSSLSRCWTLWRGCPVATPVDVLTSSRRRRAAGPVLGLAASGDELS